MKIMVSACLPTPRTSCEIVNGIITDKDGVNIGKTVFLTILGILIILKEFHEKLSGAFHRLLCLLPEFLQHNETLGRILLVRHVSLAITYFYPSFVYSFNT